MRGWLRASRIRSLVGFLVATWIVWIGASQQAKASQPFRFEPLAYEADSFGGAPAATPEAACKQYAETWGWHRAPFSFRLESSDPGRWRCQRYVSGQIDPGTYVWITGRCQRRPVPIRTGSDWAHPSYDISAVPSCRCDFPRRIDRSTEWCTGAPSCEHYPYSSTSVCGSQVRQLDLTASQVTGPIRLFHDTQTCIARGACDDRCKMENCNWLNGVVRDFVQPYVQKQGRWPLLAAQCSSHLNWGWGVPRWLHDRMCAGFSAGYHITADLLPSLSTHGCGTERDWEQVFDRIKGCTSQSFSSPWEAEFANAIVYLARSYARDQCFAERQSRGVDRFIEPALAGRECRP